MEQSWGARAALATPLYKQQPGCDGQEGKVKPHRLARRVSQPSKDPLQSVQGEALQQRSWGTHPQPLLPSFSRLKAGEFPWLWGSVW